MELLHGKIVSGCVIFLVTVVCGCGPFVLLRRFTNTGPRHRNRAAHWINCTQSFACGIFIGTCLLHLLPEASEDIQDSLTSDLPVSEMLVALGFLLLLVTENLILACHGMAGSGKRRKNNIDSEHSVVFVAGECSVVNDNHSDKRRLMDDSHASHSHNKYGAVGDDSSVRQNGRNSATQRREVGKYPDRSNRNPNTPLLQEETEPKDHPSRPESQEDRDGKESHDESEGEKTTTTEADDKKAVLKSFVLLFALSLHTVFDGLVVGLQSREEEVWTLLAAVGLHKALVAVSIAISLLKSHYHHPRASLLYLSLFSLVAPAGLAVGAVLTETRFDVHAQTLTSGVLQSVATGTFMYVTFVESLKGRFEGRARLLNVLLVLVGFGLVCGLRVVLPG
ncbi:zinc transporter ZIP1-like [Babylonia areolata]|uniref:zinc transporter ZIP1-like n=1 Tax=Babylonia areolata TaxID=304850 RepID=UPI003FD5F5D3